MSKAVVNTHGGKAHAEAGRRRGGNMGDMGFLCFKLNDEEFGVDLHLIKQIVKPPPITRVPRVRAAVLGIISIRGAVVTLMDMRLIMRMEATSWPRTNRVLLIEMYDEQVGLLVDAVSQVRRVTARDFEEEPELKEGAGTEHVIGIIRPDEETQVTVIDIREILAESML